MARAALLLALLAGNCGETCVESFSFPPGALQEAPSIRASKTRTALDFARNTVLSRSHDFRHARGARGSSGGCLGATTVVVTESADYLENKEALKQDLQEEYASFFDNFESDRYLPDVQFIDPVTSFTGFQNYKKNLDMLGGRSALGKILFKDASIVLHEIEEPGPFRLRTRWTLTVCFKALPWQPVPCFTGISDYTIDEQARVIKQEDFWDSINLVGGRYQAVSALLGVKDFVGQVLPSPKERAPGGGAGAAGQLLRRAEEYEVWRAEGGVVSASREFEGEPTEAAIAANSRVLLESLSVDGLGVTGKPELVTPRSRNMNEVSVSLTKHDWMAV